LIFIDYIILQETAQRIALPALGRGRRSRPTRKMIRRRKLLEIAAESPASGARFVGWRVVEQDSLLENKNVNLCAEKLLHIISFPAISKI
jgi:hypothetical protein